MYLLPGLIVLHALEVRDLQLSSVVAYGLSSRRTKKMESVVAPRLIRRQELEYRTGFRRSTIYAAIKSGGKRFDPDFPQPVRTGKGTVAWLEEEVDAWIKARVDERNSISR